jgi:hypothetical protein
MGAIGRGLGARGWTVGYVNDPPGIHHMLNLTHEPVVGQYLSDMAAVLQDPATQAGQWASPVPAQY